MKLSFTRTSILSTLVVLALVAAIPFAVWEFIHTGKLYILSHRFLEDIVARLHGPGRLRFILQPVAATAFGTRDGLKDARAGRPPFLRDLIFHKGERRGLMRSALASVRDLVAIAILLDVISQLLIFRMVHPGAALLIGPVLIGLPYASSRALANRASKWRSGRPSIESSALTSSLKKVLLVLAIAIMSAALASPAYSQTAASPLAPARGEIPELRVAAIVVSPSVIEQNGNLTGFSVDLWNAIAARLNFRTTFEIEPDVSSLENSLRSKKADLVLSLFITSARDQDFDFSIPTLQAGLQILVRDTGERSGSPNPLLDLLRLLFSRTTAVWLGVAFLLVLIPAHVIWFLERRHADSMLSTPNYFPGIFEVIYWGLSSLTSQAQTMPHEWVARVISNFWMFVSVVFVALYTAQLTATLTVQQIRGAIEGPGDLPGKQVATVAGTTAVDYLRAQNAQVQEFKTADQMYKALRDKKVDAVVAPAPLLLYYAAHEGNGLVKTVGPEFNTAPVAVMVPLDSPLRRKINLALIALRENGTYQQIYDKWFGTP